MNKEPIFLKFYDHNQDPLLSTLNETELRVLQLLLLYCLEEFSSNLIRIDYRELQKRFNSRKKNADSVYGYLRHVISNLRKKTALLPAEGVHSVYNPKSLAFVNPLIFFRGRGFEWLETYNRVEPLIREAKIKAAKPDKGQDANKFDFRKVEPAHEDSSIQKYKLHGRSSRWPYSEHDKDFQEAELV